jgi:hypothetical protein
MPFVGRNALRIEGMENQTNTIELKRQFKDKAFTNKELYDFYLKKESELK